jgi:hypothetical protein
VVAFIAGQTAPPGKRMGHAGAIVSGGAGTAQEKMARFERAGVPVAKIPSEIPGLIHAALAKRGARRLHVVPTAARPAKAPRAAKTRSAAKRSAAPKPKSNSKKRAPARKRTRR